MHIAGYVRWRAWKEKKAKYRVHEKGKKRTEKDSTVLSTEEQEWNKKGGKVIAIINTYIQ